MEDLEQLLSCPICMETFKTPKQLPCQHSYCTLCLDDHIRKTKRISPGTGFSISCPLCRETVQLKDNPDASNFPTHLTIQSILESEQIMGLLKYKPVSQETKIDKGVMASVKTRSRFIQTSELSRKRDKSVMTTIETRSRFIQTDKLPNETRSRFIQTDKLPNQRDIDSTEEPTYDLLNELFTFNKVTISIFYRVFLEQLVNMFVPSNDFHPAAGLIIENKVHLVFLSIFSFICFIAKTVTSIHTEIKTVMITLLSIALLFQLLFVRIKFGFSMIRHRLYAFIAYLIILNFTFIVFTVIFEGPIYHVGMFIVTKRYCLRWNDTTHTFEPPNTVVQLAEAESAGSEYMNSKTEFVFNENYKYLMQSNIDTFLNDYFSYLNACLLKMFLNIVWALQNNVAWVVSFLVGCIVFYFYRNGPYLPIY